MPVFITNHPNVRQYKFKVNGQRVAFVDGVLTVEDNAIADALKAREVYPIYDVHFHLRDTDEPLPVPDEGPTVRLGARSTESFKTQRRR